MSLSTPAQGEPEVPAPVAPPVDVVEAPVEDPHTPVALETEEPTPVALEAEPRQPPNTPVALEKEASADIHIDIAHPLCRRHDTLDRITNIIEQLQLLHDDLKNHS